VTDSRKNLVGAFSCNSDSAASYLRTTQPRRTDLRVPLRIIPHSRGCCERRVALVASRFAERGEPLSARAHEIPAWNIQKRWRGRERKRVVCFGVRFAVACRGRCGGVSARPQHPRAAHGERKKGRESARVGEGGRAGEDGRTDGQAGERAGGGDGEWRVASGEWRGAGGGGGVEASNIKRVCIRAKNRERRTAVACSLRAVRAERAQNRRSADGSLPCPSRRVVRRNKTIFPSTNLRLRDALRSGARCGSPSRQFAADNSIAVVGHDSEIFSAACFSLLFFLPGSLPSSLRCF